MQTTMSSRSFNQDTAKAKRAALDGPVIITDRGRPAHVLLTIEAFQQLSGRSRNIIEALAMPAGPHIEFEPEPLTIGLRPVEFD